MFKRAKSDTLALDAYGTRLWRSKRLNKAECVYAKSCVANAATILFVFVDFICLYTVWNTVQTESMYMLVLIAIGCAVCLDVPLAVAGNALKSHHQKLKGRTETALVMSLAIATFLVTFALALWFRIETRELTFSVESTSTMTNTVAQTEVQETVDSSIIWAAALFNGVVPLCTSIASFVISYFAADPLGLKIARLDEAIITLDANLVHLEMACKEAEGIDDNQKYLYAREPDMSRQFRNSSQAQGVVREQATRFVIMEKLDSPNSTTALTRSGERINRQAAGSFETSERPSSDGTNNE